MARTGSGLYFRYRLLRRCAWRWLDRHPRVDGILRSSGALSTRDGAIPRGVAVGLFVALMPFFGIQTLIAIAGCILVRGNFPAGLLTSWINNPFTATLGYFLAAAAERRLRSRRTTRRQV